MQLYIQKLAEADKEEPQVMKITKSTSNLGASTRKISKAEGPFEIDKKRLKKVTL